MPSVVPYQIIWRPPLNTLWQTPYMPDSIEATVDNIKWPDIYWACSHRMSPPTIEGMRLGG